MKDEDSQYSSFRLHPSSLRCPRSSGVERLLGKEEVMSSNLIAGSIIVARTSEGFSKEYRKIIDCS